MNNIKIKSNFDNLELDILYKIPDNPKGIVSLVHGMSEHKERYIPYMEFLVNNGYAVIIHDHRGHGKSVKDIKDLGYFYTENIEGIVNDLYQVISYMKDLVPNTPTFIFSHSMGTLVTRCFLQKYDNFVDKVVLCGPPTKNSLVGVGLTLAKMRKNHKGEDNFINNIAFKTFNKNFNIKNEWTCKNMKSVSDYNNDPLCGFIFTTNGFLNLFKLQKYAFKSKMYKKNNRNLPILFIAGSDDPVIISHKKFNSLVKFFNKMGYTNTSSKLYESLRHELLNEEEHDIIYSDVLEFFNR